VGLQEVRCLLHAPRSVTSGLGVFAHSFARELYTRAVLAQISQAGTDLQASAASPRGTMTALLENTAASLDRGSDWQPEPWLTGGQRPARREPPAAAGDRVRLAEREPGS
jgi:hypothetical protein